MYRTAPKSHPQRIVVLDTETTGLSYRYGDRVCEIGAIEVNEAFEPLRDFHAYMNPERPMPVAAYNVHGLSTAFLKKQPVFREIAPEFVEFVRGARIVAHNASFDAGFINHELFLAGYDNLETLGCTVFDTLRWARSLFQGYPNGLDHLCRRFGILGEDRSIHGALSDAELLRIVCRGLTAYEKTGVVTAFGGEFRAETSRPVPGRS